MDKMAKLNYFATFLLCPAIIIYLIKLYFVGFQGNIYVYKLENLQLFLV